MKGEPPLIRSGAQVAMRLFDVAMGIDLARAGALWAAHDHARPHRPSQLVATLPKALSFEVPPLQIPLGECEVAIDGRMRRLQAMATLYDFGVVALSLRWDIADAAWSQYVAQARSFDAAVGGDADADRTWRPLLEGVLTAIHAALDRPLRRGVLQEDYLCSLVHALDAPTDADALIAAFDIPQLLAGESQPLSAMERRELMARTFSYFADDLVVLTWDRAFIYEPRRDVEVLGILEIANAQLVELRHYDELLDDELPVMNDLVADTHAGLFASRKASRLARKLYTLVAEVTELTERVENALQVTEDVYLARVYTEALELFRVPKLSAAVDRKLGIIRDTYTALYDEASSRRAEVLEIAIVVLILFEVVMAFVRP